MKTIFFLAKVNKAIIFIAHTVMDGQNCVATLGNKSAGIDVEINALWLSVLRTYIYFYRDCIDVFLMGTQKCPHNVIILVKTFCPHNVKNTRYTQKSSGLNLQKNFFKVWAL